MVQDPKVLSAEAKIYKKRKAAGKILKRGIFCKKKIDL